MPAAELNKSDPKLLARVMELGTAGQRLFAPEELGAILEHQLAAPVQFDLEALEPGVGGRLARLAESQGLLLRSFGDLLLHPYPPVELLVLTKRFAKAYGSHPDSPLPREISMLLYYASILVALMRCGQRITELDDSVLREGATWLIAQGWVDPRMKALLKEGVSTLSGSG